MLRYKNSLLERILLEKGIDVQAELRLKTGAPGATAKPAMPPKAAPGPTARPAQRLPGGITSKPDAFAMSQRDGAYGVPSPQFQATPTSHVSSPSHAKSPGFGFQGAMSPVGVEQQGGRPQLLPQPRTFNNQTSPPAISMPQTDPTDKPRGARGQRVAAQYYPSPFQKHYDQLGKSLYVTSHCESVKSALTNSIHRARVRCTSRHGRRRPRRLSQCLVPSRIHSTVCHIWIPQLIRIQPTPRRGWRWH